jgi:quercetin dioxygenase-like cupin family protein
LKSALQRVLDIESAAEQRPVPVGPQTEELIHFRDGGKIAVQASAATGSHNLAAGTQQVMVGTGIPIHRHMQMDEVFYVLEGSGTFILDEQRRCFTKGATLSVPQNSWHGFENPEHEVLLLWIVSPPGLEDFFRETCSAPGTSPRPLSSQQIHDIAMKYGTEFR